MAVLVEGISVVTRIDTIHRLYPGGWEGFRSEVPNATLCADNDIARIGFMVSGDARAFIERLQQHGFQYIQDTADVQNAQDLVVVDQLHGPMIHCDWIEFGHVPADTDPARKIAACRLTGSNSNQLFVPEGWKFEGSLSDKSSFVPTGELSQRLKYLGTDNGVDVYLDMQTGEKVYAGRSGSR